MRARLAMLADYALAHPDGKIYVLGGGIEIIRPDSFPYVHPTISLVAKIEFTAAECGRPHTIEIHPLDADGRAFAPTASTELTPQRNPEYQRLPVSVQFVIHLQGLQFDAAGSRVFSILVDGAELDSVPLHIVEAPKTL
jgi:hypothetical protein